jgi:hypothetical protein
MLRIKWNSTPEQVHVATFTKSIVGTRIVVETFTGQEEDPCRVESGRFGTMMAALLNPAGRYRLAPMMGRTLTDLIESVLDSEPESQPQIELEAQPRPQLRSVA